MKSEKEKMLAGEWFDPHDDPKNATFGLLNND